MTGTAGHALEQALAYYRAPALLAAARDRPLPDDVLDVIRVAAGDTAMIEQLAGSSGEATGTVSDASVFFVQQVLFANGADSYRVLGVNHDAPDTRIKEHYRWLVRWLHPDRNVDDWDSVYADRVNVAWQSLRLPDRRRDYDQQRPAATAITDATSVAPARPAARRFNEPEPSVLSARAVQRLPAIVLGALGAGAVSILALMWVTADSPAPRVVQARAEVALEPAARRELPTPEATQPIAPAVPVAAPAQPRLVERADPPAPPDAAVAPSADSTATTPAALAVRPAAAIPPPAPRAPEVAASAPAAASAVALASGTDANPAPVAARSEPPAPTPRPAPSAQVAAAPAADPAPVPMPTQTPVPAAAQTTPTLPTQATAASKPDAAAAVNAPALDGEVAARAVAREFSRAYGAGDINALMQLFTADARNNRGGRDAIVYDYQSLFSGTSQRELRLVPAGWISRDPAEGTLLADYEASVTRSGARKSETSRGQIRFDLRRVNGDYRISQVRHDDR